MSNTQTQQQQTAPTTGAAQMQAPEAKKTKLVRIKAIYPIACNGNVLAPGDEAEVSEELAKEFCDRKLKGNYAFSGERSGVGADERHIIVRAERVKNERAS